MLKVIKEYPTRAKKSTRKSTTMYLKLTEKKELIQECGDAALILYEYWLLKAGIPDFQFTDYKSAKALGWSQSKATQIRLKLTKADYFHEASARYTDGRHVTTSYLGKEMVKEIKEYNHRAINDDGVVIEIKEE